MEKVFLMKHLMTRKFISSLPMSIAVDSEGGILYWTNARGNILSMPGAGGKVTNNLRYQN